MLTKDEKQNTVEGFLMFIIYAFRKPADVINGCQSQVVHCHEQRFLWTKLA